MKNEDKRFLKYLLVWFLTSLAALAKGITYAAQLRGYPAIGGEWFAPLIIGIILYLAYNRKSFVREIKALYNSEWTD